MARERFKTNMNKVKADSGAFESGGGSNFFKMADGKHLLRILPPWKKDGTFYQKVGIHRPPGKENVSKKVICPEYTFGKKGTCPICKAKARVYKEMDKDAAKNYAYQKRAYLNVLDMKKGDGQVYVFEAPATVMNPILNFMAEEESDQLVDLNEGYNILITRGKDGGFTKYSVMIKPGSFDLEEKGFDVDEILGNLNDLGKFAQEPDAEDFDEVLDILNEITFGDNGEPDSDPQDDDDPPPKKLKSAKVDADDDDDPSPKTLKKKAAAPVEEDDDDDIPVPTKKKKAPEPEPEEDADADDDDAPAPPKKVLKKKAPEPEPEDDADDVPVPKKKKTLAAKIEDDDLNSVESFDEEGFDPDSDEIPF